MLIEYFNKLKKSTYIRNIATLGIGTLFAQLILIGITPVVTRIYSPEQIGLYTMVLAVVSLVTPVVNGRYEVSIVVADTDHEANVISVLCLFTQVLVTTFVGIVLILSLIYEASFLNGMGIWVLVALPLIMLNGTINMLSSYNNRFKQYRLLASVSIVRSLANALGQILFGILHLGSPGLLLSQLLSGSLGIVRQSKYAINNFRSFLRVKTGEVIAVGKKYKRQFLYSAPATLMNAASYSILNFFIAALFGLEELGYYFLSYRMLGLPIQLVSMNVSKVYFARAAEEYKNHHMYRKSFIETLLLLLVIAIPGFSAIAIFAPELFKFIFGESWGRAGVFVAILSPMFATRFITSSLSLSLVISNKQKYEVVLQAGFIIVATTAYLLSSYLNFSIEKFLLVISGFYTLNYLIVLTLLGYLSKRRA
ncbi:lipopolysaccharide biosynthesis protein [Thalassobacillus pellis]|uniref:lipopolysaccharide biosynthesis protein n=1 Tax=Thalassobacillus pellis TaxID=748008 RepID=UPI001961F231|nr:oligosaccharide flippase family protein [Thalassobacillus pellis]MBM7551658.1 O-antigen/teichoic acid export membrane protein [Thalassobacillus pellis]